MTASSLLKQARRRAGVSQRELAARSGVDQAVIGRIEAGTTSPRFETLERLLQATGHALALVTARTSDVDRAAIRALLALDDRARETWFVETNANMLRLFDEARTSP